MRQALSCRDLATVPRCGSLRLSGHNAERGWPGLAAPRNRAPGRRSAAEPLLFDAVGELVELLCDIEQIVAQQSAFHSLGGVPDEPRSLSALLGGRVHRQTAAA
jgi:hypothetical protein